MDYVYPTYRQPTSSGSVLLTTGSSFWFELIFTAKYTDLLKRTRSLKTYFLGLYAFVQPKLFWCLLQDKPVVYSYSKQRPFTTIVAQKNEKNEKWEIRRAAGYWLCATVTVSRKILFVFENPGLMCYYILYYLRQNTLNWKIHLLVFHLCNLSVEVLNELVQWSFWVSINISYIFIWKGRQTAQMCSDLL